MEGMITGAASSVRTPSDEEKGGDIPTNSTMASEENGSSDFEIVSNMKESKANPNIDKTPGHMVLTH